MPTVASIIDFFSRHLANIYKGNGRQARIILTCSVLVYSTSVWLMWCNKKIEKRQRRKLIKNRAINIGAIFGMDVGGTLAKLIYFEKDGNHHSHHPSHIQQQQQQQQAPASMVSSPPSSSSSSVAAAAAMKRSASFGRLDTPDHREALQDLYSVMMMTSSSTSVDSNSSNGGLLRDDELSIHSSILGGRLHFMHFETRNMVAAINLLSESSITENIHTIGCTGGGAHKYEQEFSEQLGIRVESQDELAALIKGMLFAMATVRGECFTYRPPKTKSATAEEAVDGADITECSNEQQQQQRRNGKMEEKNDYGSGDEEEETDCSLNAAAAAANHQDKSSPLQMKTQRRNSGSSSRDAVRVRVYSDSVVSTPIAINPAPTTHVNHGHDRDPNGSPAAAAAAAGSSSSSSASAAASTSAGAGGGLSTSFRGRSRTNSFCGRGGGLSSNFSSGSLQGGDNSNTNNKNQSSNISSSKNNISCGDGSSNSSSGSSGSGMSSNGGGSGGGSGGGGPSYASRAAYTERVELEAELGASFPYLIVNIGSGVSILKVTSATSFERVSGSSVGGGTFWGLTRLFTGASSYSEALTMSEEGDATHVDMLVSDIYGGGYDNLNLSGSMVASSFGKLVMKDDPREGVQNADVAQALLMMITNNIGQVAYLNAKLHKCSKIFFIGNFLRQNEVSCRKLAFAIHFWSKGEMEATFFKHEGYFGALGTFLASAFGSSVDDLLDAIRIK